ncbi:MAG: glycosyltransferase family 39 protein, partial [Endomicrobiales bacterium]
MNYTLAFWLVNAAAALLRLPLIGRLGLSGDEAHYWAYTRHLELSYFDHPPLISYLIKAFTLVFGNTEFAVRLPTVLIFFFATWLVFRLARDLYGEKAAFWSAVLLNVTPVFSFLGAVMTVPDAPLSLLWIVFVCLFYRTMQSGTASNWYILGAVLGFGMLSKYNAVLLVPSAFLFLAASEKHRYWLSRREPYLA